MTQYKDLHEMISAALCPKNTERKSYTKDCLKRERLNRGLDGLFYDRKMDENNEETISWWTFEYTLNEHGKKRLTYLQKTTKPVELAKMPKKALHQHACIFSWPNGNVLSGKNY